MWFTWMDVYQLKYGHEYDSLTTIQTIDLWQNPELHFLLGL